MRFPTQGKLRFVVILFFVALCTTCNCLITSETGCADGTREGLHGFWGLAACDGGWQGHIKNASHLCGAGWKVCSHHDVTLLKEVTWSDATKMSGCYVIDAAQDGGSCHECTNDLEKDDVAAVGHSCPHQIYGQSSCISGGKIDASCCVDTHLNKSCMYQPGLMTGVVCCRRHHGNLKEIVKAVVPAIVSLKVPLGDPVLVSCRSSQQFVSNVKWYKDGHVMPRHGKNLERLRVLTTGDLLIRHSRPTDTGIYRCYYYNSSSGQYTYTKTLLSVEQKDFSVPSFNSGCITGAAEEVLVPGNISACAGAWSGHVRNAQTLCGRGWHICSSTDGRSFKNIPWQVVKQLNGCYTYIGANILNKHTRCRGENTPRLGKDCTNLNSKKSVSLPADPKNVFHHHKIDCKYDAGVMTGALCCKGSTSTHNVDVWKQALCTRRCENGGTCFGINRCLCTEGFHGNHCQKAVCNPPCGSHRVCLKPGVCACDRGYFGKQCQHRRHRSSCHRPCYNGGRCHNGKCRCSMLYSGRQCHQFLLSTMLMKNNSRN